MEGLKKEREREGELFQPKNTAGNKTPAQVSKKPYTRAIIPFGSISHSCASNT